MDRIDKYIAERTKYSRKEIKALIQAGQVQLNGRRIATPEQKVDPAADHVTLSGETLPASPFVVLMLHKPAGYVTSTDEPGSKTVMELLPQEYRNRGLVPVGRLDKETEGLLLFTNDGALLHKLISPKYCVEKEYYAEHEGIVSVADIDLFRSGVKLRDGTICRSAELSVLAPGKSKVIVTEGKYHQVRRMLAACGHPVTYLRRDREGDLCLVNLHPGQFRILTPKEELELRNL